MLGKECSQFVRDELAKGYSKAELVKELTKRGYTAEAIKQFFAEAARPIVSQQPMSSKKTSSVYAQAVARHKIPFWLPILAVMLLVVVASAIIITGRKDGTGQQRIGGVPPTSDLLASDPAAVSWDTVSQNLQSGQFFQAHFSDDCLRKDCNWDYFTGYLASNGKWTMDSLGEEEKAYLEAKIQATTSAIISSPSDFSLNPDYFWYFYWMHTMGYYPDDYSKVILMAASYKDASLHDSAAKQKIIQYANEDGKIPGSLYLSARSQVCEEQELFPVTEPTMEYDYLSIKRFCGVAFTAKDRQDAADSLHALNDSRSSYFQRDFPELFQQG